MNPRWVSPTITRIFSNASIAPGMSPHSIDVVPKLYQLNGSSGACSVAAFTSSRFRSDFLRSLTISLRYP